MSRRKALGGFALLAAGGLAAFVVLSSPRTLPASALPNHEPDAKNGEYVFYAAGCASCHTAPGSKDKTNLPGGLAFKTPFGTFYAPNISAHPKDGIGGWSQIDFVNAVMRGVSPDGRHYYPAFPYTSYQRMRVEDVLDLKAFMDRLPAVMNRAPDHDLLLPFRLRRGLGLWKTLYMDYLPFQPDANASDELNRGAYLVEGPGHCGECHTPRNIAGGKDESRKLAGGPAPEGEGFIPNITPHPSTNVGQWSAKDIADTLKTGFLPDYSDSLGGSMTPVIENMAKLTEADLLAIAAYLKSVGPVAKQPRK